MSQECRLSFQSNLGIHPFIAIDFNDFLISRQSTCARLSSKLMSMKAVTSVERNLFY